MRGCAGGSARSVIWLRCAQPPGSASDLASLLSRRFAPGNEGRNMKLCPTGSQTGGLRAHDRRSARFLGSLPPAGYAFERWKRCTTSPAPSFAWCGSHDGRRPSPSRRPPSSCFWHASRSETTNLKARGVRALIWHPGRVGAVATVRHWGPAHRAPEAFHTPARILRTFKSCDKSIGPGHACSSPLVARGCPPPERSHPPHLRRGGWKGTQGPQLR